MSDYQTGTDRGTDVYVVPPDRSEEVARLHRVLLNIENEALTALHNPENQAESGEDGLVTALDRVYRMARRARTGGA